MKTLSALTVILCGILLTHPSAGADLVFQTNYSPVKEWRLLAGKPVKDTREQLKGEVVRVRSSDCVEVELFRYDVWWEGPTVSKGGGGFGPRDRREERIPGPHVVIQNVEGAYAVGEAANLWAFEIGTTNLGNGRVLKLYDRGTDYKLPTIRSNLVYTATEKTATQNAQTLRVIAYQLDRASNGSPSFQFEIGRRYFKGDGVDRDLLLARHWLQAACTNGLSEATNLLAKIP